VQCYRDVEIGHQKDEGEDVSCKASSAVDLSRSRVVLTQVAQTNSNMALTFMMPISTKYKPYRDHVPGCCARRVHKTQISLFLALFVFFGIAESMSGKDDSLVRPG